MFPPLRRGTSRMVMMVFFIFVSFYCYTFLLYSTFSRKYPVRGIHVNAVTASESHSEPQSYGKRHKKALGKARKSGAEDESLKLLKEICAIFSLRT